MNSGPADPVYDIAQPLEQSLALVFASPHSGQDYPADFVAQSPLDATALRRSEDSFVDEIFAAAPALGAPLIRARFPRAYVDPNREPYELDPRMFEGELPGWVNTASPRIAAGLGTIARVVANGAEIYRGKLRFAEAAQRIERCYKPYHLALAGLVGATRRRFGLCLLVDCHSMPSVGGPMERDAGEARVDIVLGDCFGGSAAPDVMAAAEAAFRALGYRVARNAPYAGGFTTRHYGQPAQGVHALQIEINRALYMDEATMTRKPHLVRLAREMEQVIAALSTLATLDGGLARAAE
jgi:N-formylglutamate amidohydrolase